MDFIADQRISQFCWLGLDFMVSFNCPFDEVLILFSLAPFQWPIPMLKTTCTYFLERIMISHSIFVADFFHLVFFFRLLLLFASLICKKSHHFLKIWFHSSITPKIGISRENSMRFFFNGIQFCCCCCLRVFSHWIRTKFLFLYQRSALFRYVCLSNVQTFLVSHAIHSFASYNQFVKPLSESYGENLMLHFNWCYWCVLILLFIVCFDLFHMSNPFHIAFDFHS